MILRLANISGSMVIKPKIHAMHVMHTQADTSRQSHYLNYDQLHTCLYRCPLHLSIIRLLIYIWVDDALTVNLYLISSYQLYKVNP